MDLDSGPARRTWKLHKSILVKSAAFAKSFAVSPDVSAICNFVSLCLMSQLQLQYVTKSVLDNSVFEVLVTYLYAQQLHIAPVLATAVDITRVLFRLLEEADILHGLPRLVDQILTRLTDGRVGGRNIERQDLMGMIVGAYGDTISRLVLRQRVKDTLWLKYGAQVMALDVHDLIMVIAHNGGLSSQQHTDFLDDWEAYTGEALIVSPELSEMALTYLASKAMTVEVVESLFGSMAL